MFLVRRQEGQDLVEFALIAPLPFLLLFGILEFGVAVWRDNTVTNSSGEGARAALLCSLTDIQAIDRTVRQNPCHLVAVALFVLIGSGALRMLWSPRMIEYRSSSPCQRLPATVDSIRAVRVRMIFGRAEQECADRGPMLEVRT